MLRTPAGQARLVLPGTALIEVITTLRLKARGQQLSHQAICTNVLGQGIDLELMTEQGHVRAAALCEISFAAPGPDRETLSLSDASIIAVTERLKANVLTGDTYWSRLSDAGHLKVNAVLFPRTS